MNPTTIGLDIAKNVFQAHGVDQNGKVVVRKRLSRTKVVEFLANLLHSQRRNRRDHPRLFPLAEASS